MKFPYEREMCEKTTRFFMPIQHKNENKLEECCDIMDHYEEYLNGAFHTAFGNDLLYSCCGAVKKFHNSRENNK